MRPKYDETTNSVLFGAAAAAVTLALAVPAVGVDAGAALAWAGFLSTGTYVAYALFSKKERRGTKPLRAVRCPECESYDTTEVGNGFRQCRSCRTVFVHVGEVSIRVGRDPRVLLEA